MSHRPDFATLIGKVRQWDVAVRVELVRLFQGIVDSLQDPQKLELQRGKGASTVTAEFEIQPSGTVNFTTSTLPTATNALLHNSGARLSTGGAWLNASSKTYKEKFEKLNRAKVLASVRKLRVDRWRYKGTGTKHIGPFAEDFNSAFGVGEDGQSISPADVAGVSLVCVQELAERLEALERIVLEVGGASGKKEPRGSQKSHR